MLNFGKKVLHLRCDSHTSFKVKRSKVRVRRDGRGMGAFIEVLKVYSNELFYFN